MLEHLMMSNLLFPRKVFIFCFLQLAAIIWSQGAFAHSERDSLYLRSIQDRARKLEGVSPDSSSYWARVQLREAKRLKYKRFIATAYNQLGINYSRIGKVDSAFYFYDQAKSYVSINYCSGVYNSILLNQAILYREVNDIENAKKLIKKAIGVDLRKMNYRDLHFSLLELGNCFIAQDSVPSAIQIFEIAFDFAKYSSDTIYMAGISINLASEYINMSLYDEAKLFIDNAVKYFSSINNTRGICFANTLLGEYYSFKKEYAKALSLRIESLPLVIELEDVLLLGDYYEGIGASYYHLNNYDSSLLYHKRALDFRIKKASSDQITSSHFNIAQAYFKLKDINNAKFYIDKALNNSEEGNQQMFFYSHRLAAQIDSSLGNYSSAYKHMGEALKYHEAYFNDESKTALLRSKAKSEKEAQVLKVRNDFLARENLYNKELEHQRTRRNQWIFGSTITVLLILLIFAYRSRKEQAAKYSLKLKLHNSEMDSLNAQIDTHFIYNTLSAIQQFMYSQRISDAMSALQKFGQLMRNSLSTTRKGSVSLRDELSNLQLYIDLTSNKLDKPPKYALFVDHQIDAEKTIIPPMFIQPLIENAIKHGISSKANQGEIRLNIFTNDASSIRVQVMDNGPQLQSEKQEILHGLSMSSSILKERLQLYNAKLKTSKYTIQLNIVQLDEQSFSLAEMILPVLN